MALRLTDCLDTLDDIFGSGIQKIEKIKIKASE